MVDLKGMMGENKRKRMEQVGHLCLKAVVRNKLIMLTLKNCFSIHLKKTALCETLQLTALN